MNLGLIQREVSPQDWIYGGQILKLNESGDWLPEMSGVIDESQIGVYLQTDACTLFALCRCIGLILDQQLRLGLISATTRAKMDVLGLFDTTGHVNLSPRYNAHFAGITQTRGGTTFVEASDTFRHKGFVGESKCPFPDKQRQPVFTWDDYYTIDEATLVPLGLQALDLFDISYTQVLTDDKVSMLQALQEAPLGIGVNAWYDTNGDGVYESTGQPSNHMTVLLNMTHVADSLPPGFIKQLVPDYKFSNTAILFTIKDKSMPQSLVDTLQAGKDQQKWLEDFKNKYDKMLIRNIATGEIGRFYSGQLQLGSGGNKQDDLILNYLCSKDKCPTISQADWERLPKQIL